MAIDSDGHDLLGVYHGVKVLSPDIFGPRHNARGTGLYGTEATDPTRISGPSRYQPLFGVYQLLFWLPTIVFVGLPRGDS